MLIMSQEIKTKEETIEMTCEQSFNYRYRNNKKSNVLQILIEFFFFS